MKLREILPILVVGILVLGGLGAVALPEEKTEKLSLSFSQLSMHEKDDRIMLELEGANSVLLGKNHYMVPIHIETFTFPFGTEIQSVQVTPKNIHVQTLTKKLVVSPEPVVVGQIMGIRSQKTVDPIAPSTWYEYDVGTGLYDEGRRVVVKVETFPVQYHPSEDMVEWAENVEIEIKHKEPEQQIAGFDDEYVLIILAPDEFSDELNALVNHKISRGISTIFVSLNDIYTGIYFPVQGRDNPEKIKYFIKNAVEGWGTTYVLLVGGSSKFPTRTTHVNVDGDKELFVSDLYYADIYFEGTSDFSSWDTNDNDVFGEYKWNGNTDDVDLHPDVYLGRLACTSGSQVTTCVNKIKTYENNEAYTQDWFTNLVVVGGDSFTNDPLYGDDSGIDEGELVNQEIIDIMDGFIPDKIWDSNGRLSKVLPPCGVGEISNAINGGCGFVDFSGHGNPQLWATHPHNSSKNVWIPTPFPPGYYHKSKVSSLSNGDELPIVVLGGCSLSKYNSDSSCFGWSWLSNSNGGGIGSFGPTALGYAYMAEYVTYGLIEGMAIGTFEAYKDEGATTFGEMWAKAITNYVDSHSMKDADYKTVEEWQPFGDPSLAIASESQPPEKPDRPDGPTSGGVNTEYTYTTSTTDPDGDQVSYLWDWGDGTYSIWLGPYNSGATASATHSWSEQGTYSIRVKAKDEHGVQSPWSDPLPVTMPTNQNVQSSQQQSNSQSSSSQQSTSSSQQIQMLKCFSFRNNI